MPPWLPTDDCKEIQDPRGLSADVEQAFADWAANEHAPGVEEEYEAPPPADHLMADRKAAWGSPSFELSSPLPYKIRADERPDDYRCIVLDHNFDTDTWIRGAEVRPD